MKIENPRQLGLTALLLALVVVLESKASLGAYASVLDHVAGVQHAALSAVCALLALVFSAMAGGFKVDERPAVRRNASLARLVSVAFLLVPVGYLGSSLKQDRVERDWQAYAASDAYAADVALANDRTADSMARAEATYRITKPSLGLAVLDGEFWLALFFQLTTITAAGIRVPTKITAEEQRHWRAVAIARKGVATRKRNAAKKAAKAKKPALRTIAGGKA